MTQTPFRSISFIHIDVFETISLSQVSGVVLNINMYKEVTDPNTGVIKFQTINLESTEKVEIDSVMFLA